MHRRNKRYWRSRCQKAFGRRTQGSLVLKNFSSDNLYDSNLLTHIQYDVNDDFDASSLPEEIDGYIYFPGSINLRPFERFALDEFQADLNINYLYNVRILQKVMGKLKKSANDASVVFFSTVAVQTGMPFTPASQEQKEHWKD